MLHLPLAAAFWLVTAQPSAAAPVVGDSTAAAYLNQARVLYDEFEFERCASRLKTAASLPSASSLLSDIELYWGLCAFSLGQEADAKDHFRLALRFGPTAELPRGTSPKIVAVWNEVKAQVPIAEPTPVPPAQQVPRTVERTATWLPVVTLGLGVVAGGTGVVYGLEARRFEADARAATFEVDQVNLRGDAIRRAQVANVSYAVAATCLVAAAVTYWVTR
jgi:hypothetical protein